MDLFFGVFEFKKRFQSEVNLFLWWIWGAYFLAVYFLGFIDTLTFY